MVRAISSGESDRGLARRRDMEKLYTFSQGLLESRNVMELVNKIPTQIVNAFEIGAAALFLLDSETGVAKQHRSRLTTHQSPLTNHELRVTNHVSNRQSESIEIARISLKTNGTCHF